ncbi:MAG: VWA domain-containing protein [Planctomycetaceae bacterium]|nr:VWA domain-containing protein [Planctomycetaceae bacterium]
MSPQARTTRWQLGSLAAFATLIFVIQRWISPGLIRFQYPELFLLGIPLWMLFQRWGQTSGATGWLRFILMTSLLVALTGPEINIGGRGIDVIVVADRSRSLPQAAQDNIKELIQNLENNRRGGNRVGVVTFGSKAEIEHPLSEERKTGEYSLQILPDGSDLSEGLHIALNLVNPDRPARILVLSDGEANGADPSIAARRARELGVPVDVRPFERQKIGDLAVESVLLPEMVGPREPFQFSVWVHADRAAEGTLRVLRDGKPLSSVKRDFVPGMNRVFFRDLLDGGGSFNYSVVLETSDDPIVENNIGAGVVRVESGPRVLVLTNDGSEGNLVRALKAASLPVDVVAAKDHPLSQDSLDRYRAVIVENVPADTFGRLKMERLAQFVEDLGGGLLLTGGERSFGTGGYFKSPLDEVLPVSMEIREEHRKTRLALAVALDRSGSMMAPVSGGKVKMDLANLGTIECIKMLSSSDSIAVIAVDSAPHVVQPLTRVDDPDAISRKVRGIQSMGGGIFVYEALVEAGKQLMKAGDYSTRHIVLFSDAADSEEPGDYIPLLQKFEKAGITVSVIGLGAPTDVDGKLLEDIAKRGRGNILFTNDAEELPRLFTQDTMSVARSSFIKKDENTPQGLPGALQPIDAKLLGDVGKGPFPNVDGYNLSYLKPDARAAVISKDEYSAPWSAFWYRGLGRAAALTFEVDGPNTGAFGSWDEYADFLVTHVRWLLGSGNPNESYLAVKQDGQDAVVTVELDPDRPEANRSTTPELVVVPPGAEREAAVRPEFVWTGPNSLEARFRMDRMGNYRTLLKDPRGQLVRGPAVTLPYSPEFAPRVGLPGGKEVLAELAKISGGKERADILEVFSDPPRASRTVPLLPALCILGISLLMLEIAGRRLSLWERLVDLVTPETALAGGLGTLAPPVAPKKSWWPKRKSAPRTTASPAPAAAAPSAPPVAPAAPATPPASDTADVFAQAKQRAKKRL